MSEANISQELSERLQVRFSQGLQLHQSGQLAPAETIYREILAIWPRHFDSLHLTGVIALQHGDPARAIELIEQALAVNPQSAEAYNNLGSCWAALNNPEQAMTYYDQALVLNPDYLDARLNQGDLLTDCQRFSEALQSYQKAILLAPENATLHCRHGHALARLNQSAMALSSYDRALALQPADADAYFGKGRVLEGLSRYEEALAAYIQASMLQPDNPLLNNDIANVLSVLRRYDEAVSYYDKAIALHPQDAKLYNNRANALAKLMRYDEALRSYEQAIELQPDAIKIYKNRADMLFSLGYFELALVAYQQAMSVDPDYECLFGMYLHTKMRLCDWTDLAENLTRYVVAVRELKKITTPLITLSLFDSPELQKITTDVFADYLIAISSPTSWKVTESAHNKIRVGYYSADFHDHATCYLMAELFERHSREHFEFYAFAFESVREDAMRNRVVAAFDGFFDVSDQSDDQIIRLSQELGIDIAVDLKGYTQNSRSHLFARRCAPIQVNFLGFPGTLSIPSVDYILADRTLIPPENQSYFSEKVVYLPNSYQVNQSYRPISPKNLTRSRAGLPATGFVFCCFNDCYKITPQTFDVWVQILQAVEGSVLWLLGETATAINNLKKEAESRGLDSDRLVFAKFLPIDEHLARCRLADLFLDTLPCNAHTTASDALWAGLPVLTCQGQAFAGRVAASVLNAIRLPELITDNYQDYAAKAIELATHPEQVQALKARLEHNRRTTPLFDPALFAHHLEAAYQAMYRRNLQGLQPDVIEITD